MKSSVAPTLTESEESRLEDLRAYVLLNGDNAAIQVRGEVVLRLYDEVKRLHADWSAARGHVASVIARCRKHGDASGLGAALNIANHMDEITPEDGDSDG